MLMTVLILGVMGQGDIDHNGKKVMVTELWLAGP